MSHDESLHMYFSGLLYRGQGYQHTPMMHGRWQFDLIALSYFLFGASDFTARIPAALFSIATVWVTWHWRRYLGAWCAFGVGPEEIGLASGIAVDPQGFIWVSDAGNNRRMQYTSPSQ